jgi:hypothetical protein
MYSMGCRCLWDADTDNIAQDVFINVSMGKASNHSGHRLTMHLRILKESLFCVAVGECATFMQWICVYSANLILSSKNGSVRRLLLLMQSLNLFLVFRMR